MAAREPERDQYGNLSTRALMRELIRRLYPGTEAGRTDVVESGYHTSIRLGDSAYLALGVTPVPEEPVAHDSQPADPPEQRSARSVSGSVRLTPSQLEVLSLWGAGHRVVEIARERSCAEDTVRNHLKACRTKFGVSRTDDAVWAARYQGLLR